MNSKCMSACWWKKGVWRWHKWERRIICFTLRPRQTPCSKELCSFSYPKKTNKSFNTPPILVWRVGFVDKCSNPTPTPDQHLLSVQSQPRSPFFFFFSSPPLLPPLFFFFSPIPAGRTLPPPPLLHLCLYWNFLLKKKKGKWRTGGYWRGRECVAEE